MRSTRWTVLVALGLISCTGTIGEPIFVPGDPRAPNPGPGPGPIDPPPTINCVAGDAPRAELIRINRATYVHALTDIFGEAVVAAIRTSVESLPQTRDGAFASELGPVTFAEASSYSDIASTLAFEATKDAAGLRSLRPCLETLAPPLDPQSDPCLTGLTADLGRRLLRRPLSTEDRDRFLSAYAIGGSFNVAEGVATLLMTMLLDPRFLYFFEVDGTELSPGIVKLTPHELAARLARVLWESVPDPELATAADTDLEGDALRAQIDRLWGDDRARETMSRFYRDWLDLENLPYPPQWIAPTSGEKDELRVAMIDDLVGFTSLMTFDRDGTYRDLLLDRTAFVNTPLLAQVYGLDRSVSGQVELPELQRAGVLTRPAWLMSPEIQRSNAGHIIKRGARLGRFICRELPPPDPNLFPANDPADPANGPTRGIRERFQDATTEQQCAHCHRALDAFGGPFGHYGAAGEWIDVEHVVVDQDTSRDLQIDAMSTLALDAEELSLDGALELSRALADSRLGVECFATQLTRRTMGRRVDAHDACLVKAAAGEGSIKQAVIDLLTTPEFAARRLP